MDRTRWLYDADGGGSFVMTQPGRWVQEARERPTASLFIEVGRNELYVELMGINPPGLVVRLYDDHFDGMFPDWPDFRREFDGCWAA